MRRPATIGTLTADQQFVVSEVGPVGTHHEVRCEDRAGTAGGLELYRALEGDERRDDVGLRFGEHDVSADGPLDADARVPDLRGDLREDRELLKDERVVRDLVMRAGTADAKEPRRRTRIP